MRKTGFTLIELLIVIALLGVLAVGLLATIDPFEQLKKGRDTSTRNMLEEFYNGSLRYYAIKDSFPWSNTALSSETLTDMANYLTSIQAAGELKQAFLDASGLDKILVSSTDDCDSDVCEDLRICFQPQSKAFRNDNNTKWDEYGSMTISGAGPTCTTCYWCIK